MICAPWLVRTAKACIETSTPIRHRGSDQRGVRPCRGSGPTGKSVAVPFFCRVLARKINRFAPDPNQTYKFRRLIPHEGRIAIVTDVGMGCGGRDSVVRADVIAGRVARSVSDLRARETSGVVADGEVVWS